MKASEARKVLANLQIYHDDNDSVEALFMAIESLKICAECVYFKERPHGEWIQDFTRDTATICSKCGEKAWYKEYSGRITKSNFCPNCGADMRPKILDQAIDGAGKDGNVKEEE